VLKGLFRQFQKLDFSHFWAKGIDKLLTPTAQEGVIEGPTPYQPLMMRLLAPRATALKTSLQDPQALFQGDFLVVAAADRHPKIPKGLGRRPNRCGVLVGQMAKVEQKTNSRKFFWRAFSKVGLKVVASLVIVLQPAPSGTTVFDAGHQPPFSDHPHGGLGVLAF
jgi:hypothetical protein